MRYAARMTLHVALQSESNAGRIYPPYLEISYSQVDANDRARVDATATV